MGGRAREWRRGRSAGAAKAIVIVILGVVIVVAIVVAVKKPSSSFDTGWSHTCTLVCDNVSTGAQEEVQRVGKNNTTFTAVCKETKLSCESGRSAACANTANWTNNNEPLYNNCTVLDEGTCVSGCARN